MLSQLHDFWSEYRKIIIPVMIVLSIGYLSLFFKIGIFFEDTFLEKSSEGSITSYVGKNVEGRIRIDVKEFDSEKSIVTYRLPNQLEFHYTVLSIKEAYKKHYQIEILDDKDDTVFKGTYDADGFYLRDDSGEIVFDYDISGFGYDNKRFLSSYRPSFLTTVKRSLLENETYRGDGGYLAVAIILSVFIIIDINNPLFFFYLRNALSVKDPEPSELYMTLQHIAWIVYPFMIFILLIIAL
ncbi:MAG: hypothetical protein JEZ08_05120 [Clostridiales bacterium]|nr:hypothetical protein [Clostridiales bacterium]